MQAERASRAAHLTRGSLLELRRRSVPPRDAPSGGASLVGAFPATVRSNIVVINKLIIFVRGGHLVPERANTQLINSATVASRDHLVSEVSPPSTAQADEGLFCGFEGFDDLAQ
jgi:hypothetical protein